MCGRYVLAADLPELAAFFDAGVSPELAAGFKASYNVPPTGEVPAVAVDRAGERKIAPFHWGLVPSWARDRAVGNRAFNARAESVASKPLFREAFRRRRCLVPAAPGFYEWSKAAHDARTPYLFVRSDGEPMAFAGLFEFWRPDPEAPWERSCTIITTDAGEDVAPVHGRQPVVLERDVWERWLDREFFDRDELEALLAPSPPGLLRRWAVSRDVGRPSVDAAYLLEPAEAPA